MFRPVTGSGAPRIKVCGLTRADQARRCGELGIWAIGVILARQSPRCVDPAAAAAVLEAVPDGVGRVGVFVDHRPEEIAAIVNDTGMTHVQVHGDLDARVVADATGVPVIQGIPVDGPEALERARSCDAAIVLLDAAVAGKHGGTGRAVDWGLVASMPPQRPWLLAGGLTPENVAEAVDRTSPWGVDVASGVEAGPGIKDMARVERFVAAVRACAAVPADRGAA